MGIAVGTGLATYPFQSTDGFWRWIQLCEEGGIDSYWQTDTLVSREPMLECMTTIAAVAGATKKLKFGMNVASVGIRDPLLLAKQCATVDVLSNGRMLPAFGIGNPRSADWRASGAAVKGRGRRTDEGLDVIAALWRGEEITMQGEFYSYDRVRISPIPIQQPLPLWIGGSSEAAIKRTARIGTGWQAAAESPQEAGETVAKILAACAENGRAMDPEHFGIGINFRFGSYEDEPVKTAVERFEKVLNRSGRHTFAAGDAGHILGKIKAYVDQGISKFVLRPLATGDEDTIAQTERLVAEVMPEIAAWNAQRKAAKKKTA